MSVIKNSGFLYFVSFYRSSNTQSVVEYVPHTEMDYGSLLCWATNSVGRQRDPCIFHLVPAGVPDALKRCIIGNQTTSSLHVRLIIYDYKFVSTICSGFVQTITLFKKNS